MGISENPNISAMVEPAKRKYRSKQERRQIAEESLQPGASVAVVARAHGVNANQVFQWRKLYREGLLHEGPAHEGPTHVKPSATQLVPVRIMDVMNQEGALSRSAQTFTGTVHVELGRTRLRVEGQADPECLRLILEHISR